MMQLWAAPMGKVEHAPFCRIGRWGFSKRQIWGRS
jgi:hypothetical protein